MVDGDERHRVPTLHQDEPQGLPAAYASSPHPMPPADSVIRDGWVEATLQDDDDMRELKWSAAEMRWRAERAQACWDRRREEEVAVLDPCQRPGKWKTAWKQHKADVKKAGGGPLGLPGFSKLSYFMCGLATIRLLQLACGRYTKACLDVAGMSTCQCIRWHIFCYSAW